MSDQLEREEFMKIYQQTIAILKQFAAINPGIVISPGSSIATRSDAIVVEATVPETFPIEVRLPDIHEFVRLLSLFKEPVCEFDEDHVRIVESDGTAETVYALGKPGSVPQRQIRKKLFPTEQITLTIGPEQWETLRKALGVNISKQNYYGGGQLTINSDGQKVQLIAQRGSHTQKIRYSFPVPAVTNGFECAVVLCASNLPSLPGPYEVTVFPLFVQFQQSGDYSFLYYVGAEPQVSTWGGRQVYQVKVTKTMAQECVVSVNAHSPEEAEALAQEVEAFDWTGEPRQSIEWKAVGS
jgi:hypothetical protein